MPTSKFSLEGEIFHGELAEVRIWGVARTEKEISVAMYDSILTDAEGLLFSSTKELQSP